MAELTKFECDVTGDLYGSLNAGDGVEEYEIRSIYSGRPFEVRTRTVHISHNYLSDNFGYIEWPRDIKYIGVKDGEVQGICMGYRSSGGEETYTYEKRDNVMTKKYEKFFIFLEDEVIY